MKLISLELIGEYKGLQSQTFSFSESNDSVIALIGLNGSGKSQLLELLAEALAYIERKVRKDFCVRRPLPFGVEIVYSVEDRSAIGTNPRTIKFVVTEDGSVSAMQKTTADFQPVSISMALLPKHVIGYSSGLNENLQRAFLKNTLQYFDVMRIRANRRKKLEGLTVDEASVENIENHYSFRYPGIFERLYENDSQLAERDTPLPALTFIDYDCAALLLASLAFQPREFFDRIFPEITHRYPHKLIISYDLRKAPIAPDTYRDIQQLIRIVGEHSVRGLCPRANDDEFELYELDYLAADVVIDIESLGVKEQFREAYFNEPIRFFEKLYKIQLLGAGAWQSQDKRNLRGDSFFGNVKKPLKTKLPLSVTELQLQDDSGALIDFDDLSDGEAQLIQTLGVAYLFGGDSLFLFDEPETHLNPIWRTNFHKHLKTAMADADLSQAIVTTHSPFLISSLKKENVYLVERNDNHSASVTPVPHETYGASFEVLIKQHFALKSMISQTAVAEVLEILKDPQLSVSQRRDWIEQNLGDSMEKAYLLRRLQN